VKYRKLNNILDKVSEIGFGCWGIGGEAYGKTNDNESIAALETAVDLGINFFDTSPFYGRSEKLVGETLKKKDVIIATKFGMITSTHSDFSVSHFEKSLDNSLRVLGRVDLMQLHSPELSQITPELIDALKKAQQAGKVRCYGLSTRSPSDADRMWREFNIFQINFNIADMRLLKTSSYEFGDGIIARTPFAFGFLADSCENKAGSHIDPYKKQTEIWQLYKQTLREELGEVENLALRFCLSYNVSTVIPGMLSAQQVKENVKASEQGRLTKTQLKTIKDYYIKFGF
jgi:aryl-alcohol dehydrogenase-like predicted oxidoreductase